MRYDKMTKAELIAALKSLQSTRCAGSDPAVSPSERTAEGWQRLVHELQVHQLELEMQNRELQEAHGLLEESRDRYADLYDFAPVGYVSLDEKGCIREINLSGAALLGRERSQLIGKPFIRYVVQRDVKTVLDHLQRSREANEKVIAEVGLAIKGVESIRVQLLSVPVYDAERHVTGCRTAMTDITERKRVEEERDQLFALEQAARQEAEAANRAKDAFLATVSHELRTPLTAMLGWARMLRSGSLDAPTSELALESIGRNATAQAHLIEDLLDMSRIISGKLRLNVTQVQVVSVIQAVIDSMRPAAEAKGIRIITSKLDQGADLILADADRLQQVIWNLLSNAIKFTPKGGRVEAQLERVGSQVEIRVRDTGQGITPDFLPYVFDRFRQADSHIGRKHGGLGLGLAIVRHIVELHGGTVDVQSEGEGTGATFSVRFPSATVPSERVKPSGQYFPLQNPPECPIRLDGLRILVVDDEADAREFISLVLKQYQAEAVAVNSVAEALEELKRSKVDILLSDLGMPGESGYDLIHQVRVLESKEKRKIPAIALTAYARVEDRIRALAEGYQMHVPKPVEPAELVMAIASLLGRSGPSGPAEGNQV